MDLDFTRLAERRILAALAEGKLSHLAGEGRPLPDAPPTAYVDPGAAIGMRIMAEAGFLPAELELHRELSDLHKAYRETTDPEMRAFLMRQIADVSMRENIAREARLHLLGPKH